MGGAEPQPEGVQVFAESDKMVETPGLQAVVIAPPTDLQITHTVAAMEREIHVLCEKPITTDVPKLQSLIKASKAPTAKLMVGFVRRFDKIYADARRKVESGLIGKPLIVRSQGTEKLDKTGFFINYARVSGGIFLDAVIHDIDLTLSFFGDSVHPKSCYVTGIIAHHEEMKDFGDVENAIGVVEFQEGRIAYYYHSRTTMHGFDNCTEIVGSDGKGMEGIVQEAFPSWIDQYQEAFVTEMNIFTDAILEGKELPMKLEAALTGLKIAGALQESLVFGKKTEFDKNGERTIRSAL
ncbi:hypothetical protein BDW69DRAFT_179967 [Aspergillus filifer]